MITPKKVRRETLEAAVSIAFPISMMSGPKAVAAMTSACATAASGYAATKREIAKKPSLKPWMIYSQMKIG